MAERRTSLAAKSIYAEVDESRMVLEAKQDPNAFEELYLTYVQPVYRYIYSRLGSVPEAEDITAQTFLAAFEAFGKYRHEGYFAAWLFSIAHNKSTDHFRKVRICMPIEDAEQIPVEADPLRE